MHTDNCIWYNKSNNKKHIFFVEHIRTWNEKETRCKGEGEKEEEDEHRMRNEFQKKKIIITRNRSISGGNAEMRNEQKKATEEDDNVLNSFLLT